jgi:hypothetical protein
MLNPLNPQTAIKTKSAIIRPGQRKPYVKATKAQIAQRIECARLLLHCGYEKSQIHRVFRGFYQTEWRQTDRYLCMARAHARAHAENSSSLSPSTLVETQNQPLAAAAKR